MKLLFQIIALSCSIVLSTLPECFLLELPEYQKVYSNATFGDVFITFGTHSIPTVMFSDMGHIR